MLVLLFAVAFGAQTAAHKTAAHKKAAHNSKKPQCFPGEVCAWEGTHKAGMTYKAGKEYVYYQNKESVSRRECLMACQLKKGCTGVEHEEKGGAASSGYCALYMHDACNLWNKKEAPLGYAKTRGYTTCSISAPKRSQASLAAEQKLEKLHEALCMKMKNALGAKCPGMKSYSCRSYVMRNGCKQTCCMKGIKWVGAIHNAHHGTTRHTRSRCGKYFRYEDECQMANRYCIWDSSKSTCTDKARTHRRRRGRGRRGRSGRSRYGRRGRSSRGRSSRYGRSTRSRGSSRSRSSRGSSRRSNAN